MGVVFAMTLPGLACLLVLLAALERLGMWFSGRSWVPWRRKRDTVVSSVAFDQVTALFYATKHYELQQRASELVLRDDQGDREPGRLRLEFDAREAPALRVAEPHER